MRPKFTKTSLGLAIVACLQVLSPMSTYAQTITYGSYRTSVNGSITSGNRLFESADIYVDSAGGLSGGTQIFAGFDAFPSFPTPEGSNLRVSAANGVTGGQQIFHHYSQAFVSATHGMSGANITLHDDSLVDAMADDAFGTGASILFAGNSGLFLYGEQFLKLNGHNTTIGAINSTAGKGRISNVGGGTAQFTVSSGAYSGVITDGGGGALGLTKAGAGTLTLSGSSNTYSGGTTITAGTLIATNGGALGSGNLSIGSAGTLQATGTITGAIGVTGTLSNSPGAIGSLTTGAQTWNGGGSYAMDFSNAAGAAGTGYDLLAINGQLGIASNSGTPFTIAMNSKSWVPGFDSTANGTWTLAQTTGITGYDAGDFAVSTANFANGFNGTFSVVTSGNNLVLNYTGAPNIVTGGWNTSTNGSITSSVRQMGGLTVNTANGVSGGDIYAGAFEITASDGITGGYQQFNSGGSDSFLYAARSITGGTQVFNGSNDYVYISANDAITGGVQTFNVNSVDMTSGSISGGEQRFYGGTALSSNGGGTITGGTQKFYNLLSIFESGLSVTGGEQNFYNGAELLATAGGITGGVQNF